LKKSAAVFRKSQFLITMSRAMRGQKMKAAMENVMEFGILLLLVFAFSAPMLAGMFKRHWGQTENEED
jgi:hypothetical protein